MKLPVVIRLLGIDYRVITDSPELAAREAVGHISYAKKEIHIDSQSHHPPLTILHELVHGIADSLSMSLPEEKVELIARAVLIVMRDNPGLVASIAEAVNS